MKKFSFVVALVVSALVLGCQDSNMTNPISNDFSGQSAPVFSRPSGSSLPDGSSEFKVQLNPRPAEAANGGYEVTGNVQYILMQSGDETYELALVAHGSAENLHNGNSGSFYGESIDWVSFGEKGFVELEKTYPIDGVDELVSLHIRYTVTQSAVVINKIWMSDDSFSGRIAK